VARAVGLAIGWPGPGSAVLNVGTGKNHSVMDMAAAATKTAARKSTDILPAPIFQEGHPADVPETLASLERVGRELGWEPTVFFPDAPVVAETGNLEPSPVPFSG
jgi:nucleoside-diphosphate-sugar epimerase